MTISRGKTRALVDKYSFLVSYNLHYDNFFLNLILIYKLNMQIQISLIIGNLYSADLITGISSMKKMNE